MPDDRLILVTGATGKVGRHFIGRLLADPDGGRVRALCHNRVLDESARLEVVRGSIADREVARRAMTGVSHVVHLATCKETPEDVMDVTVRGLFWLLEEARTAPSFSRFLLIGGDAGIGHFFYRREAPVTEDGPFMAYPGCYALSKVLEEVMLEQFGIQYDLDHCCLRAPWIMEKDDLRFAHSFGADQFGGPLYREMVPADEAARHAAAGAVPILLDADGAPLKRNFVHVDDLASAILVALDHPAARRQTFHVCMDEPLDYGAMAAYLAESRGVPSVPVASPFHSVWLDNAKARLRLGWRPAYDLKRMVDSAWDHVRAAGDPRRVWYPG
ncbi:MAG: NAD(P)-dependent oxidoreductase [Alphaproteobacteria bacterium]